MSFIWNKIKFYFSHLPYIHLCAHKICNDKIFWIYICIILPTAWSHTYTLLCLSVYLLINWFNFCHFISHSCFNDLNRHTFERNLCNFFPWISLVWQKIFTLVKYLIFLFIFVFNIFNFVTNEAINRETDDLYFHLIFKMYYTRHDAIHLNGRHILPVM